MAIVLLLTGCVVPNTDDVLAIKDASIRKNQYLYAIKWYLKNTDFRVVFGENSGTDLSPFINDKYAERVEFLTFSSSPTYIDRGKGYKEMEIIEYCFLNSRFINGCDIVVKGTGRLVLLNILPIVSRLIGKAHFICSWMSIKQKESDSRFFFCSPDYLEYFINGYKEKIHKRSNFEENLAKSIREKKKCMRFIYPSLGADISGVGGGYGTIYNSSRISYLKSCIKCKLYAVLFNLGYWPLKSNVYR